MSPDLEIIKSLNPTVVVSVDTLGSDYMNLFTENNIPSEFVSLESLDGLKEAITTLGKRFDKNDEATALLNEIEAKELEVQEKAAEFRRYRSFSFICSTRFNYDSNIKILHWKLSRTCWWKKYN